MSRVDLIRHLSFFVAVAEEGHFGHAADRLGMTQPPVSQGVRRLEERLGVTLFVRGARGVGLTPVGAELLPRAAALVADARRFEEDAHRRRDARVEVRVGVVTQLGVWHVAAVVAAARRRGATATTRVGSTVELVGAVLAGQLDLAVVHHPALVHPLESGRVLRVPTELLVPAGLAVQRIGQLRGLALATVPRSHNTAAFDLLVDSLRLKGLDPEVVPAPTDRETVAAVASGRAFGITADTALRAPGVERVALGGTDFHLRVRLVWRAPGPDAALRDAVEAAVAEVQP